MKDYLLDKYTTYIENLQWHLDTNHDFVTEEEKKVIEARILAYREFITDIKML